MANVLPPDAKAALRSTHTAHLVAFGSGALLASALLAFVALLPSYVILKMQESQNTKSTAAQSAEVAAAKQELARSQNLITLLSPLATSTTIIDTLDALLADKPAGTYIDSLSYTKSAKDQKGEIVAVGTSSGREDVNAFRIALEKDPHFDGVSVPINALTGAESGHFTITVSGKF